MHDPCRVTEQSGPAVERNSRTRALAASPLFSARNLRSVRIARRLANVSRQNLANARRRKVFQPLGRAVHVIRPQAESLAQVHLP